MKDKVGVVGSGSWGTAFANAMALKGLKVTLWARNQQLADDISEKHENTTYLPDLLLSPRLRATCDLNEAIGDAGVIVMAVPSHCFRDVVREASKIAPTDSPIVSLAKGLEIDTMRRMSEVIAEEVPASWPSRVATLSGPNLAKEIALGYPAAAVVACADAHVADTLQDLFMSPVFRTYSDPDVVGVEVGGIVKNLIAIATGIAEGLGFGDNTKA
ncbi:MAG: NAD(P)H-dependent glycerol-3-phosphate dehydrogenase, partial [Actinobacteria bacterium]|nr:NAD(P)H-dependent glycerol-3-phosphate dehydrogenase [Actinomycetota bacterium]